MRQAQSRHVLVFTLLALSLLGCSDPKAATKSNFAPVVEEYLAGSSRGCSSLQLLLGGPVPNSVSSQKIAFGPQREKYEALVAIGLLSVEGVEMKPAGFSLNPRPKTVQGRRYEWTDAGREALRSVQYTSLKPEELFCWATPELHEIVRFSEPADQMGRRVTQVEFTYTLSEFQDWANRPEVTEHFGAIAEHLRLAGEPIRESLVLVLNNDGWAPASMF